MSEQIAVRVPEDQVASIDQLVAGGDTVSRAELVSRAVARIQRQLQVLRELAVIRAQPYEELDDLHLWATAHRPTADA